MPRTPSRMSSTPPATPMRCYDNKFFIDAHIAEKSYIEYDYVRGEQIVPRKLAMKTTMKIPFYRVTTIGARTAGDNPSPIFVKNLICEQPNRFYVVPLDADKHVREIRRRIKDEFQSCWKSHNPAIGRAVIVEYKNCFERGSVFDVKENGVEVYLVDIGLTITVPIGATYTIRPGGSILCIPPQAIRFAINDFPDDFPMSADEVRNFVEYTQTGQLFIKIYDLIDDPEYCSGFKASLHLRKGDEPAEDLRMALLRREFCEARAPSAPLPLPPVITHRVVTPEMPKPSLPSSSHTPQASMNVPWRRAPAQPQTSDSDPQFDRSVPGRCRYCDQEGHYTMKCMQKKKDEAQQLPSTSRARAERLPWRVREPLGLQRAHLSYSHKTDANHELASAVEVPAEPVVKELPVVASEPTNVNQEELAGEETSTPPQEIPGQERDHQEPSTSKSTLKRDDRAVRDTMTDVMNQVSALLEIPDTAELKAVFTSPDGDASVEVTVSREAIQENSTVSHTVQPEAAAQIAPVVKNFFSAFRESSPIDPATSSHEPVDTVAPLEASVVDDFDGWEVQKPTSDDCSFFSKEYDEDTDDEITEVEAEESEVTVAGEEDKKLNFEDESIQKSEVVEEPKAQDAAEQKPRTAVAARLIKQNVRETVEEEIYDYDEPTLEDSITVGDEDDNPTLQTVWTTVGEQSAERWAKAAPGLEAKDFADFGQSEEQKPVDAYVEEEKEPEEPEEHEEVQLWFNRSTINELAPDEISGYTSDEPEDRTKDIALAFAIHNLREDYDMIAEEPEEESEEDTVAYNAESELSTAEEKEDTVHSDTESDEPNTENSESKEDDSSMPTTTPESLQEDFIDEESDEWFDHTPAPPNPGEAIQWTDSPLSGASPERRPGSSGMLPAAAAGSSYLGPRADKSCYHCHAVGHRKYECPEIQCLKCKEYGHIRVNCLSSLQRHMDAVGRPEERNRVFDNDRDYEEYEADRAAMLREDAARLAAGERVDYHRPSLYTEPGNEWMRK